MDGALVFGPDVSRATFEPHLNTAFQCRAPSVTLTLIAVADAGSGRLGARTPFALVFSGPPGLAQGTYALTHSALGTNDVFLVPIKSGTYEAVFN